MVVNHLSAITAYVRSVNELKEQMHFIAEEVIQPYRHTQEKLIETVHE